MTHYWREQIGIDGTAAMSKLCPVCGDWLTQGEGSPCSTCLRQMGVPEAIRQMVRNPGRYFVATHDKWSWCAFAVEVEPDGTVHQLTPEGVRDGVLSPDGWSADVDLVVVKAPDDWPAKAPE